MKYGATLLATVVYPVAEFKEFERLPLKIVSNVSRFKPPLNLNRVLADLNRGSNSLNSISGEQIMISTQDSKKNFSQLAKIIKAFAIQQ